MIPPSLRRPLLYGSLGVVVALYGLGWLDRLRVEAGIREAAERQLAVLEALGAARARLAARNAEKRLAEMQAVVPSLQRELAAARAAGATVGIVTSTEGHGSEVTIPCEPAWPPGSAPTSAGAVGPTASARVTPWARSETAIFVASDGRLATKTNLFAWVTWPPDGKSPRELLPPTASDTVVDPRLQKAWEYYQDRPSRFALFPRAPRHWRAGWTVGPGLVWGGDRCALGAAVIWGAQF